MITRVWLLALTFGVAGVVYVATASDAGRGTVGATGRTSISLFDRMSLPALSAPDSVLAFGLRPAGFGLLELTDALLIMPLDVATISLRGIATPRWVDIQPSVMHAWHLTPAFVIGAASSLRYAVASDFDGSIEVRADVHAVVALDDLWTFACVVNDAVRLGRRTASPLAGPTIHAAIARGIGNVIASIDVALANGEDIGLLLEVAHKVSDAFWYRAACLTHPFSLIAAVRAYLLDTDFVFELSHIEHLGVRTLVGVELVP